MNTEEDFKESLEKAISLIYEREKTYRSITNEQLKELAKRLWGIDLDDYKDDVS